MEQSSLESQSRGCAKTPILTVIGRERCEVGRKERRDLIGRVQLASMDYPLWPYCTRKEHRCSLELYILVIAYIKEGAERSSHGSESNPRKYARLLYSSQELYYITVLLYSRYIINSIVSILQSVHVVALATASQYTDNNIAIT